VFGSKDGNTVPRSFLRVSLSVKENSPRREAATPRIENWGADTQPTKPGNGRVYLGGEGDVPENVVRPARAARAVRLKGSLGSTLNNG